jgi:acetyl esterase/lipase
MSWVIVVLALLALAWLFTVYYLRGENLSRYNALPEQGISPPGEPSAEHLAVVKLVGDMFKSIGIKGSPGSRVAKMRAVLDSLGDDADLNGIALRPINAGGVPAEWIIADGADMDRRLLYIHGGAWMMGSPKSHRRITTKLSRITGAAVLAIDYRLMPEHPRLACVEDCQTAYRWVLENGPQGRAPVKQLFVAGDSAGGNLTLVTIAWARDAGLRRADAVVAIAPATDGTLSSPSLQSNLPTDHMIGPMFGHLAKIPSWILLWAFWLKGFVRPSDPRVSPAHHDLSGLPPTLVHASEAEMLLDDARRYVNKATAAGSPTTLETWPHMVHVWHFFEPTLPEAKDAFEHIASFIEQCAPRRGA